MKTRGKLIILQGLPGSGKTLWARKWVNEAPKVRVRINRDDIRSMLGPYWIPSREGLVSDIEENMVMCAMFNVDDELKCYDIVLDATNFKHLEKWKEIANFYSYEVEIKEIKATLKECIERDSKRENPVGAEVIKRMYNSYIKDNGNTKDKTNKNRRKK